MKIVIPDGLTFERLQLRLLAGGDFDYNPEIMSWVATHNGQPEDFFDAQPEDVVAEAIIRWYLGHLDAGGEPDPVAEEMLRTAQLGTEPHEEGPPLELGPAAFRAFCHSLGLSAQALATLARVQERAVRRWWSEAPAPAGVIEIVQRIDSAMDGEKLDAIDRVHSETEAKGHPPEVVTLWAYRTEASLWDAMPDFKGWMPVQAHSVMLMRTAQALRRIGQAVEIQYKE